MAEFFPHQIKRIFLNYYYYYIDIILFLFLFSKKNYCQKSPTFLGEKKKSWVHFFPHTFSVLVFCQFPYSLESFGFFIVLNKLLAVGVLNKGNYMNYHKIPLFYFILGSKKIQPYMCIISTHFLLVVPRGQ